MTVRNRNFSGQVTPTIVAEIYEGCNFCQPAPRRDKDGEVIGVRLFPGDDRPRRFVRCNLVNCEPPPGSELIDCNTTLCEPIDLETDAGKPIDEKGHRVYGRLDTKTNEYVRYPIPQDHLPVVLVEAPPLIPEAIRISSVSIAE